MADGNAPTSVSARLTLDDVEQTEVTWTVQAGANPNDGMLFRFPFTNTLLTGRHTWSVSATYSRALNADVQKRYPNSGTNDYFYVDRNESEFGKGWFQQELAILKVESSGLMLITGHGEPTWFSLSGGTYTREQGDQYFYTVSEDASSFTLTDKYGSSLKFLKNTPSSDWARLESKFDASGNERRFTYYTSGANIGKLQSIQDIPTGDSTVYDYPPSQVTITEYVGSNSRATTVTLSSGQLTSIILPDPDDAGALLPPVWEYAYSGTSGLLTKTIDPVSSTSEFTYGGPGPTNETVVSIKQGADTSGLIPYNSNGTGTLKRVVDSFGQFTDERSKITQFRANGLGFITEIKDDDGFSTIYTRHPTEGFVTKITTPDPDGPETLAALETTFTYDTRGNVTSATKRAVGSNAVLAQQQWAYDDPDYSVPTKHIDELGRVTKYTIGPKSGSVNDRGKVLTATVIVGLEDSWFNGETNDLKTTYIYTTLAGHVGLLNTVTDPIGRVTKYDYWTTSPHKGLLKKITYNYGAQLTTNVEYEYDAFRNLNATLDELDRRTDFVYDKLDRLIKRTDPDPDGPGLPLLRPETDFAYDPAGNLIKTIDPLDNVASAIYDSRNRVVHAIPPRPESTAPSVSYADDHPINNSNFEKLGTWTLGPGSLGYQLDHRYANAGTGGHYAKWTVSGLDVNKRYEVFITWQANSQNATNAVYQVLNASETLLESSTINQQRAPSYEFDSANSVWWQPLGTYRGTTSLKVKLLQNASGRVDADAIRVVEVGPATRYTYDAAGNTAAITDALDRTTDYAYDDLNRLYTVTGPSPDGVAPRPVMTTVYWADGSVKQVTDPLLNATQYEYDQLLRNTEIIYPDPDRGTPTYTSPITRFKYDSAGQITYATQTDVATSLSRTTQYFYDELGRQNAVALPLPSGTPAESKQNNAASPHQRALRGPRREHGSGQILCKPAVRSRRRNHQRIGHEHQLVTARTLQARHKLDHRTPLCRRRWQAGGRWIAARRARPSRANGFQQGRKSRRRNRSLAP
jgi:YD repeat-containing protein